METSTSPLASESPVAAKRTTFLKLKKSGQVEFYSASARKCGYKVTEFRLERRLPVFRVECFSGAVMIFRAVFLQNDNWAVTFSNAFYVEGAM